MKEIYYMKMSYIHFVKILQNNDCNTFDSGFLNRIDEKASFLKVFKLHKV